MARRLDWEKARQRERLPKARFDPNRAPAKAVTPNQLAYIASLAASAGVTPREVRTLKAASVEIDRLKTLKPKRGPRPKGDHPPRMAVREHAACSKCGALPGEYCIGRKGKNRLANHHERVEAFTRATRQQ